MYWATTCRLGMAGVGGRLCSVAAHASASFARNFGPRSATARYHGCTGPAGKRKALFTACRRRLGSRSLGDGADHSSSRVCHAGFADIGPSHRRHGRGRRLFPPLHRAGPPHRPGAAAVRHHAAPRTPPPAPAGRERAAEPSSNGLLDIQLADRGFDTPKFLAGAREAYVQIVTAFAAGDRAALRPLLSPRGLCRLRRRHHASAPAPAAAFVKLHDARIVGSALHGRNCRDHRWPSRPNSPTGTTSPMSGPSSAIWIRPIPTGPWSATSGDLPE